MSPVQCNSLYNGSHITTYISRVKELQQCIFHDIMISVFSIANTKQVSDKTLGTSRHSDSVPRLGGMRSGGGMVGNAMKYQVIMCQTIESRGHQIVTLPTQVHSRLPRGNRVLAC